MQLKTYSWIAFLATLLTFGVIVLGAYTRITDAGLSCPDWPGCYGQLTVPTGAVEIEKASQTFPEKPVIVAKAWTEMVHRYCAGTVGLLILFLTFQALRARRQFGHLPFILCSVMFILLILQVLLGMWTVTLKLLPLVVLLHLVMGMTLLGLLWTLVLVANPELFREHFLKLKHSRLLAMIALMIVMIQIIFGGWTSTNMAGPVCTGFPICKGLTFLELDFAQAFRVFTPLGSMQSLGLFTITSLHRLGALVTLIYVGGFALLGLFRSSHLGLRGVFGLLLFGLILQMGLGFMNISPARSAQIATLHNAIAAFLLIVMITINLALSRSTEGKTS